MIRVAIVGWVAVMRLTVAYLTRVSCAAVWPGVMGGNDGTNVTYHHRFGVDAGQPFGPRQVVALVLTLIVVATAATR